MKKLVWILVLFEVLLILSLTITNIVGINPATTLNDYYHQFVWGNFLLLPFIVFAILFIASIRGQKTPEQDKVKSKDIKPSGPTP